MTERLLYARFTAKSASSPNRSFQATSVYGLVHRNQADYDWRSEAISLSSEGKKLYNRLASLKLKRARRMRKDLSPDEYKKLLRLIRKLRRGVIEELDGA